MGDGGGGEGDCDGHLGNALHVFLQVRRACLQALVVKIQGGGDGGGGLGDGGGGDGDGGGGLGDGGDGDGDGDGHSGNALHVFLQVPRACLQSFVHAFLLGFLHAFLQVL